MSIYLSTTMFYKKHSDFYGITDWLTNIFQKSRLTSKPIISQHRPYFSKYKKEQNGLKRI